MNSASTRKPRMNPVEEQRLADFGRIVFQQNLENARHRRNARAVSAHTFAAVIAACLTALQFVRTDRFFELVLLGFLVFVSVIQVLISVELTRELDDCTRKIDRQVESSGWADCVALLPRNSDVRGWLHLRWLYPMYYAATSVALVIAFFRRLAV